MGRARLIANYHLNLRFVEDTLIPMATCTLRHVMIRLGTIWFLLWAVSCSPRSPMSRIENQLPNGNPQRAIARYLEIMRANPGSEQARNAHFKIGRIYDGQPGEDDKAIKIFEKIVQSYPTSSQAGDALWILANRSQENGNYEVARRRYLQFILDFSQDPRTPAARLHLADCYVQLGANTAALKTLANYETRYPTDSRIPEVLLKVGTIHESLNSSENAAETYRRVIAEFPNAAEECALARQRLGALSGFEISSAETSAKLAREPLPIEEDETPTQIRNAAPRPSLNRRAEFKSWVASPTFGYNPRRLLMASGLLEGPDVKASMAGDGALLNDVVYNLGLMHYMSEDYKRAGACLEKALDLGVRDIDLPNLYLNLGICYKEVSAWDKTRGMFRKLASVDMNAIERLIAAGESEILVGNYNDGAKLLESLLGISDQFDSHISNTLRNSKRRQENKGRAELEEGDND